MVDDKFPMLSVPMAARSGQQVYHGQILQPDVESRVVVALAFRSAIGVPEWFVKSRSAGPVAFLQAVLLMAAASCSFMLSVPKNWLFSQR